MEVRTVEKAEESKPMDSSVRQRGFRFDEPERSFSMGDEVCVSLNNAEASRTSESEREEFSCDELVTDMQSGSDRTEVEDDSQSPVAMGSEVRDYSEESEGSKREKATSKELFGLLQVQQFRCALTGDLLVPEHARADHIFPISRGGSNQIENLQWVTDEVNRAKGVMDQDSFIAMCIKVATWSQRHA